MILVVGGAGNMGQRYCSILRHYKIPYSIFDVGFNENIFDIADSFIITSPTVSHCGYIKRLAERNLPILCEKPITKNLRELDEVLSLEANLQMVNQYAYMPGVDLGKLGTTSYNYYKHGGDGLAWDCINILGLASGAARLEEASPFWKCEINGQRLNISDMDYAYASMLLSWVHKPKKDPEYIERAHRRASEFV